MKALSVPHALILVCFLLPAVCFAQEATLMFENGETLVGEVLECTENSVKFRYHSEGKDVVGTFKVEDLDPYSFYTIRKQHVGNDGTAHLNLAKFGLQHDMFLVAIFHYNEAKKLDPAMVEKFDKEEKPALLENTAAKILARAKKAVERGKLLDAESDTSVILTHFPQTKAAPPITATTSTSPSSDRSAPSCSQAPLVDSNTGVDN